MSRLGRHPTWLLPILAFSTAILSSNLFHRFPAPYPTLLWKATWILICIGALWIAGQKSAREIARELGLGGSAARGLAWTLLASLPMLGLLAVAFQGQFGLTPRTLLMAVLVGPIAEEILFRGYLFRQLYRRAGWGFLNSVLVSAGVFGLIHLRGAASQGDWLLMLQVVGITAAGGAFFAWLLVRWEDNLWVPIGMHLFMNLWWEIFAVSPTAAGNQVSNIARLATIAAAIAITLWKTQGLRAPSNRNAAPNES